MHMDIFEVRHQNLRHVLSELERSGSPRAIDQAQRLGGMSTSFLSQLKGGKRMGGEVARKIEAALGKPHGWMDLIQRSDEHSVSLFDATAEYVPRSKFRRVPVVGTASLGMDGYWTDLEYPKGQGDGYFEFPTTDKDAYVLQVRGGSMHPAIRSGWFVVIEPNKSPQMGEFVMVKLVDGRSTVKEFLWHRDGEYVLNAISTGDRLVIAEDDIEAIHHVGGILPPSGRLT